MKSLDLNRLRIFVRIVEAGSFTRAAANLALPKSRVSRTLSALEKSLGQQLLYRTTREMRLTEAGRVLFESSKDAVEQLENAGERVGLESKTLEGLVRITAAEDFGIRVLPPLIAEFRRRHPKLRLDLLLSQEYVDLVRESVDLALRLGRLPDSSLKAQKLGALSMIPVASPKLLERFPVLDSPRGLERLPFLGLSGSSRRPLVLSDGKREIELRLQPVIEANEPGALLELALLDQGFAVLPEIFCAEHLRKEQLVQLFRSWKCEPVSVHLVSAYRKEAPVRVKAFSEFLVRELSPRL